MATTTTAAKILSDDSVLSGSEVRVIWTGNCFFGFRNENGPHFFHSGFIYSAQDAEHIARELRAEGYHTELRSLPIRDERGMCVYVKRDGGYYDNIPLCANERRERRIYDGVPQWFIASIKRLHPENHWWDVAEELPGGDGEASIYVFQEGHSPNAWLDHTGWVTNTHRGDVLVSEPYVIDADAIEGLVAFCRAANFKYRIRGLSAHCPGDTLRIEIWEKRERP